ncbi:hypothetical protein [Pseudoxanthomonas wuyuanensis]|uniref:Uncharacterized protein n=1 Tax=Pseudoxanthomonas wuyuanensis TaxID=1073196 RepID=A0A286CVI7_9GAMM|nr:hypothetical protein [Pseudoxanthomonas wuyuanensis]KAF1721313.1 hypothetical protein CSC75_07845 [Pseudoxanthomonas wuyuanensis]SOD50416.1 hypothetical protein SAMN06296416_101111 [Pseudoxanthomonas wuyuanensis]
MPLLRSRAGTLPISLVLSAASAAAIATPVDLPDAAEIEAAFRREVAREPLPGNLLARAMIESIRVNDVAGCAPVGGQLWCIVTVSGGFKFNQHRVLALSRQDGQWRLHPEHDGDLPPPPSPQHAQALMRELASQAQTGGETTAELHRAASELEVAAVRDCDLASQNGSVSCELDYRLHRDAPATVGDFRFRLSGERWQLVEPN